MTTHTIEFIEKHPNSNRQIRLLGLIATFILLILAACSSSAKKVDNAKEQVNKAQEDLIKAEEAYAKDVSDFKISVNEKIDANKKEIAEIQIKLKTSKSKLSAEYQKRIVLLEAKNEELKLKISNYKADKRENWTNFKDEFQRDLDALGTALKNFTID
jgi:vacuolar-type H+-ATPase subunit I/STV1